MRERITRGEKWYDIVYGYGKIQRGRYVQSAFLPDAVKRKLVIDPKLSEKEAFDGVSLDAVLDYNLKTERELLKVFLHAASDWDKTTTSQEDYIDNEIPEDVAKEIVLRAQRILASSETSPDEKKTST